MDNKDTAVEKKDQDAATGQDTVQKSELELKFEANESELKKTREERDNYKKGLLKAKGKIAADDDSNDDKEDLDAKIERIVSERTIDSREKELLAEKDQLLKQALARNSELETAVKNRSQIQTSTGQGSGSEQKLSPKDAVLSDEKIKAFKSMGKSDAWIERFKQNLMKQI